MKTRPFLFFVITTVLMAATAGQRATAQTLHEYHASSVATLPIVPLVAM